MRPTERRWSTSSRLILSNAGVIVACFAILLVSVVSLSLHFMQSHIEESVEAELAILADEFNMDGPFGIARLIGERERHRSPNHSRVYRLENAAGERIAGNLPVWPEVARAPHLFRMPSLEHPGETNVVAGWVRLPDGGRLLVGFDEMELRQVEQMLYNGAALSLILVLLLSWIAGRFVTRLSLQPIETIRHAANQIMAGDLRHRVPVSPSGDEFDQLAHTLNDMLDRIQQLIAGVQGATDNIAHDLRSPLARVRARLEAARFDPPDAVAWPDWIGHHVSDIDRVLATFQALLQIARVDSGLLREQFTAIDLGELLDEVAEFMEPVADARDQVIEVEADALPPLQGHRDLLLQLFMNLLDNASKYGAPGRPVTLTAQRVAGGIEICCRDHGPGIPASERERVFERLYRLDATRQTPGLGLGLSLVRAVVQLHHGELALEEAGPGLRVRLRLPLA